MSRQPSLLQITKEDGTNVLLPSSVEQIQAVRNDAAFGSGKYYAYFSNGTREMIGGPGAGYISGSGTLNYIPKFTPDGTTVGNSSLFDNGNIGYGTAAPVSVAAFDIVSTTKGILIPRMTTAQRNLIPVGAVTDGLMIYNTSTGKFNFWNQTLGIWESIDTATGGDVSGLGTTNFIPRWTDGPNSILGDSVIRDNGTVAAVNRAVIAGTMFSVQGADAAAVNYTFQTYNSTPSLTYGVRNDGYIYAGDSVNMSITIGAGSGFLPSLLKNTFYGVSIAIGLTTGNTNTVVGSESGKGITTGGSNCLFGNGAGFTISTGSNNCIYGNGAGLNTNGSSNVLIGERSGTSNTGGENTFVGNQSGFSGVGTSSGVYIGANAGWAETASFKLFIDPIFRGNQTQFRDNSLIYGKFDALPANQFLVLNGVLYMKDTAVGNYWSIVNTAGAFVFTDTGSANAPA